MRLTIKIMSTLVLLALSGPAAAYTWFTPDALLADFFPGAAPVAVDWQPDAAASAAFKARLGYPLPSPRYTFHVAGPPDAPTGFALIDDQLGQHEPITFGVKLRPDCAVDRVEVMVYREAYGEGVRAPAFLRQFTGKRAKDPLRAGKDVQIVSGATISSRSLATGTRRAATLCELWRGVSA